VKLAPSPRRVLSIILLVLMGQILLLNPPMNLSSAQEPRRELELVWARSEREGAAYSTCIIGDILYIVGATYKNIDGKVISVGTIEARYAYTGELLNEWVNDKGPSYFVDCTVLNNKLFVVEVYYKYGSIYF